MKWWKRILFLLIGIPVGLVAVWVLFVISSLFSKR